METQRGSYRRLAAVAAGILVIAIALFAFYAWSAGKHSLPGAPTDVRAERGNEQAVVSFAAPRGAITNYTVTSHPEGITATGASSPITITGLTNGTAYTFTVVAANAAGSGPASAASAGVVPMTTPGAPREFAAAAGEESVVLTWEAPESDGGGAITGYEVSDNGGSSYIPASSSTSHTFTGLVTDTTYDFCVRAVNEVGAAAHAAIRATPNNVAIPTTVGEAFTDSTGFAWQVLAIADGKALIMTEHVHRMHTRYHSADEFRPFQTAEISTALNAWYDDDVFVSPGLRARALPYAFQLEDGTPGGNGVEHQATTWVSTPATTNQQQARTIPGAPGSGDKAFVLSMSEVNQYIENDISARTALRVSETGAVGEPAYWWLRSPSTHSTYTMWLVGSDGYFYYDPATHSTAHLGFRPALWVTL